MGNERIILVLAETFAGNRMRSKASQVRARGQFKLGRLILLAIVFLIVVYAIYSLAFPSVITVSSAQSLSLGQNQTVFMRLYNSSVVALTLTSSSASGASFSLGAVPLLYSSMVSFTLTPSQSMSVSAFGMQSADMNIVLTSSSGTGASVEITPLHEVLGVGVSPGVSISNPSSLSGVAAANVTIVVPQSTSSVASTTTVKPQNSSQTEVAKAMGLINSTGTGVLMNNYAKLYAKDPGCNASTYNSTYRTYHGSAPPAPVDFANLSQVVPRSLTVNASVSSGPNVAVVYKTAAPSSSSTGAALVAIVNTSSSSFLSSVTYTGVYYGLNYTQLNSTYAFQSKILNACAAYVTP